MSYRIAGIDVHKKMLAGGECKADAEGACRRRNRSGGSGFFGR